MRATILSLAMAGLMLGGASALAQAPQALGGTPCQDGTSYTGNSTRRACVGHGGVQAANAPGTGTAAGTTTTPAQPATMPGAIPGPGSVTGQGAPNTPRTYTAPRRSSSNSAAARTTPAPGGGPGQVWVNPASHVYHCQGDRYYGMTKRGSYMTEAAAKAAGNHADDGKACS